MKGILSRIQKGQAGRAVRTLLYGVEGIGKSTWGASAPSPIFLCAEDGLGPALDHVSRIIVNDMDDVYAAIDELIEQTHEFKTLVIDTADWLEALIYKAICKRDNKESVEAYGYGKGYTAAQDELRKLHAKLDDLRRSRQIEIIILAHAQIKAFNNPAGDNFDRYLMKGHEKMSGLWKEWADTVLFARYEVFVKKDSAKATKGKAIMSDGRIVHTQWTPAWDAKNRYSLPETLPLDYIAYVDATRGHAERVNELAAYVAEHFDKAAWPTEDAKRKGLVRLGGSLSVESLSSVPISILEPAANFIKTIQPISTETAA